MCPGAIQPILLIFLVQFILFFKSSWCKIVSTVRNWINSVFQAAATTFALSSVFFLLLWLHTVEERNSFWLLNGQGYHWCHLESKRLNTVHILQRRIWWYNWNLVDNLRKCCKKYSQSTLCLFLCWVAIGLTRRKTTKNIKFLLLFDTHPNSKERKTTFACEEIFLKTFLQ